jgi:hypothetical protein
LPLKYLKEICILHSKAWDYDYPGRTRFNYWLSILLGVTDQSSRTHNSVYLALNTKGECIGYLSAYIYGKRKKLHPILFLIHQIACFLLVFSKDGLGCLLWRRLYKSHKNKSVELGKAALLGMDYKKISELLTVAICPEYQKIGIYREMTRRVFTEIKGYLIFHTSTESDYKAHEAMGYKKIFEVPYFYPEKHITFIMYAEKSQIKFETQKRRFYEQIPHCCCK